MLNYIGVKCPVCNKKFTQADDIVVCPVCGAPHHRDCYAQKAECAFVEDHMRGIEWRAPAEQRRPEEDNPDSPGGDSSPCPVCNTVNPSHMFYCQRCGARINVVPPHCTALDTEAWGYHHHHRELDPVSLMYGGISPDDVIGGESARDLALYIGENSAYYLPRFKDMDESSRTLTFNFSALIFGFLYYFHRKMYLIGTLLLALSAISAVPSFLQARELLPQVMYNLGMGPELPVNHAAVAHYQSLVNTAGAINLLIGLIISLCANRFYLSKALADVKKLRQRAGEAPDEKAYGVALASRGGVSRLSVFLVIVSIIVAYFIVASFMYYHYMEIGGFFIP